MRRAIVALVVAFAAEASAQKPVTLQLRPRIGDTVWMRLDQQTEIASKRADLKGFSAAMTTMTTTYSRAVVESGVTASTTIIAITDSVFASSSDQSGKASTPMSQKQMQGQRVRLNIAPDGSLTMPSDNPAAKGMQRAASLIPATFPTKPVSVGDKWMRESVLPSGTSQLGASVVGWVQATFRLDSLTRNGELAWLSIRGKLMPDPSGSKAEGIATVDDGTVEGYMVLDRDRGWLTESKFTIIAHSSLRQPFGVTGQPMSFEIRLVQSLKTLK